MYTSGSKLLAIWNRKVYECHQTLRFCEQQTIIEVQLLLESGNYARVTSDQVNMNFFLFLKEAEKESLKSLHMHDTV